MLNRHDPTVKHYYFDVFDPVVGWVHYDMHLCDKCYALVHELGIVDTADHRAVCDVCSGRPEKRPLKVDLSKY